MSRTFNGTSDIITIDTSATIDQLLPAFTIAAWVYFQAANAGLFALGNDKISFDNDANTNALEVVVQTNGIGALSVTPDDAAPLNAWHHIAATYDDNGDRLARIYVDGIESSYVNHDAATGTVEPVAGFPILLGTDGFFPFQGNLAEVRFYKAALTAGQIAAIAADTAGTVNAGGVGASQQAYLHLCGLTSPEPDASGNGNVGILTGTTSGPNSPGYSNCSAPPPPSPAFITPISGSQGQTLDVTVTGTSFDIGTLSFSGSGITVNSYSVQNSMNITANITIAGAATLSARNVTVTNTDTQTGTLVAVFTVTAPPAPPGPVTPVLPRGTSSLSSALITPGWPLASVPASNPLAGAPATQTPDQRDTVQGARFQSEMVTSGHANDKLI